MRPLLRERGHELFTPTYTGLGERGHLASMHVDLDSHIQDVCAVLTMEDLRDVVLVGHSYGGMVATGVADREAGRIARLVYLDAFVPRDGQSVFDLHTAEVRERMRTAARRDGEGWLVPPNPPPPDTPAVDLAWMAPRRLPHPSRTFEQPIRLSGAAESLPRAYIYCTRPGPGDGFRQFAERARTEAGWQYREIDASHNPHITAPDALAVLLDELARAV
jgi:pimeloyl-ACP methyl ester carboxylesterase